MTGDAEVRTDAELLQATLVGDEDAFLAIYRRHRDRVHRFAYRMTGSADVARDIVHVCFASLLEDAGSYDGRRAGLGTYLCTAARNQSLRYASRAWRETASGASPDLRPSPVEVMRKRVGMYLWTVAAWLALSAATVAQESKDAKPAGVEETAGPRPSSRPS